MWSGSKPHFGPDPGIPIYAQYLIHGLNLTKPQLFASTKCSLSFLYLIDTLGWFLPGHPRMMISHYNSCAHILAAEVVSSFPSNGLRLMNSAAYQKSVARTKAFQVWEKQYQRMIVWSNLTLTTESLGALPTPTHSSTACLSITICYGGKQQKALSLWAVKSPNTTVTKPPQLSNWLLTTPSWVPMPDTSDPLIPPNHTHANADTL